MNKIRNRQEIVEKMEELFEMGRKKILPLNYVMQVTDTLDWCLGDSDYLDTEKLKSRGAVYRIRKNRNE